MKSPFPGMDPFIEACGIWEDFHHDLISEIKNALALVVPDRYVVRAGERSYIVLAESEVEGAHRMQGDVSIASSQSRPSSAPKSGTAALAEIPSTEEPIPMCAFVQTEYRESFIEIREVHPERRLITCIEVLSPSNKRQNSPGWDLYSRKRQALLQGSANLVEIDLLRGGSRMSMTSEWPPSPYYLLVARKNRAPQCLVWPAYCARPITVIPVPLAAPDPDVPLAIQPMIETIYARSLYERDIDYTRPLNPALSSADKDWLAQRLHEGQVNG